MNVNFTGVPPRTYIAWEAMCLQGACCMQVLGDLWRLWLLMRRQEQLFRR